MRKLFPISFTFLLLLITAYYISPFERSISASEGLASVSDMTSSRAVHSATKLRNGTVLIAGGMKVNAQFHDSAEIFDPKKRSFQKVEKTMTKPRVAHTATLLKDGRVLFVGGWSERAAPEASSEIFDPTTKSFLEVGSMKYRRSGHSATLLSDGRVLVVGGHNSKSIHNSIEVFDPETNKFEEFGRLSTPRKQHTATLVSKSKLLLAGGEIEENRVVATAEIIDVETGKVTSLSNRMISSRYKHDAVVLKDGNVLIFGGSDPRDTRGRVTTAEVFDIRKLEFKRVGDLNFPPFKIGGSSVLLSDGRVLVAGSAERPEIFDPKTKKFTITNGNLRGSFHFATTTFLNDGNALIAGGYRFRKSESPLATKGAWLFSQQ